MSHDIDFKKIKKQKTIDSIFVNKFKIIQKLLKIEKDSSSLVDEKNLTRYQSALNYLNQISEVKLNQSISEEYFSKHQSPQSLDQKINIWKYAAVAALFLIFLIFPFKYFFDSKTGKNYIVIEDFKKSLGIFSDQIVKEIPGTDQDFDEIQNSKAIEKSESTAQQIVTNQNKPNKPQVEATVNTAAKDNTVKKIEGRGFLFRGKAQVINLDMSSKKIVDQLIQLGASKAGEVELGWAKGNMRYFHFTIPEIKYDDVTKLFNGYGSFNISKEAHPRIMPKEISRFIIEVTEKNTSK